MNRKRLGITLIEVLIVISILSFLISLILPAIFAARDLSLQLKSKNKLFALFLATEQLASIHNGQLPTSVELLSAKSPKGPVHWYLIPYLDGGKAYLESIVDPNYPGATSKYNFSAFISPADFTVPLMNRTFMCSYPANAQVFGRNANLNSSFRDGTSNTILFSEHYAGCNNVVFQFSNNLYDPMCYIDRRSTFADGGIPGYPTYGDVYPIPSSSPPGTMPSVPGKTFQVRPSQTDCDPTILQTPHSALLCGFADGSVRSLGKNISENVFWSLVTMDGGEAVSAD